MSSDVAHATEQPPSAPSFTYDRFQDASREIRLVEIIELRGRILNLKLSAYKKVDAPEYNAISYTWSDGGAPRWVEISVNDKVMHVTENCRYALEQAHSHIQPNQPCITHFWIDSICIDQSSDVEKQHQVAMMADIYAQAVTVLSCVGCHRDNSHSLTRVLRLARAFAKERLENGKFPPVTENDWFTLKDRTTVTVVKSLISAQLPIKNSLFWRFLHSFFEFSERCYWTRLWIIQEVAASKQLEVLCGFDKFSKSDIYLLHWIASCYWYFFKIPYVDEPKKKHFYHDNSLEEHHISAFSFFTFVLSRNAEDKIPAMDLFSLTFKCSRPEDRVYGMLNLVEWPRVNPPIKVEPVYQPSATVDLAELFITLTKDHCEPELRKIFEALEICHHLDEVERLIRERSGDLLVSQRRRGKYPARRWWYTIDRCKVLSRRDSGGLAAGLDCIEAAAREVDPTLNSICTASQLLYSGSKVAGLLCNSACEDDLIIQSPFEKVLLVLRGTGFSHKYGNFEYDIVGQGLLFEGFEFPEQPPPFPEPREKDGEARMDSYIRRILTGKIPWSGDFRAYEDDFKLCRRYLQNLFPSILGEVKLQEESHLNKIWKGYFGRRAADHIRSMLRESISPTGDGDLQLWCRYLEALYQGILSRAALGNAPYQKTDAVKMTKDWDLFDERPPKEMRRNALRYISCVLESVDEYRHIEKRWWGDFSLELEPLEMLLLACQDLEKDGTQNKDKMMQRLNTHVPGKVPRACSLLSYLREGGHNGAALDQYTNNS